MKKFIFPFYSEKYKFLEKKWWHRMIIFLFFILTIPTGIISYLIISGINTYQNIDYNKSITDLVIDIKSIKNENREININKFMILYPEYNNINESTLKQFKNYIENNAIDPYGIIDNKKMKELYPEFFPSQKTSKIKNILENIIYSLITLYLLIIILQLIYYKGIIYIIYGNKK